MKPRISIVVKQSADEVAKAAADLIIGRIKKKPAFTLGCATGGTVVPLYKELIRRYRAGDVDFSQVTTFNLDEYVGLPREHTQSYWTFMHGQLFSKINIPERNIHILNGMATDLDDECTRYERAIRDAGGIDLQILGIGHNGHIAFNEPGSDMGSRTRVVDLHEHTIKANSDGRFFSDHTEVPRRALSMGIATILDAKEVVLLATGEGKADAVYKALRGTVSPDVPASFLQKHKKCTFIIDTTAATLLPRLTEKPS